MVSPRHELIKPDGIRLPVGPLHVSANGVVRNPWFFGRSGDTEAPKQHRNDVRLAPRQVFSVLYHQFRFQLFPATID